MIQVERDRVYKDRLKMCRESLTPIITYCDQGLNSKIIRYGILLLIVVAILFKVHLIFCLNINWDEFYYLSLVHSYLRGEDIDPLQSFHVHFFSWLPSIFCNEINQIIVARCLMCLLSVGSGILVYKIGGIYLSKEGSLFSALCYFSFSNIMLHGSSFRMDPVCSFLFLASLYLILGKPHSYKGAIIAGVMTGCSIMVTIKSLLYLLPIALIYVINVLSSSSKKGVIKHAAVFGAVLLLTLTLLYGYHIFSLSAAETTRDNAASQSRSSYTAGSLKTISFPRLGDIFSKMFLENVFFPRFSVFQATVMDNLIIWVSLVSGLMSAIKKILKKSDKFLKLCQLIPVLLLLLTVIFYRNAWPYYYVFIMPPLFIFCGMLIDDILIFTKATKSIFLWQNIGVLFLSIAVFLSMMKIYAQRNSDEMITQRRMVKLVHQIFPEATPYIDAFSMISSYPKVGIFMSTWGMEDYIKRNTPIFRELIIKHHPVFLIGNRSCIHPKNMDSQKIKSGHRPLKEDAEVIKQNYVKHWGSLYVAGKEFEFKDSAHATRFEVLIPGVYTIEAGDAVTINGIKYPPKSQIMLESKDYDLSVKNIPIKVTLRWGKNLFRPEASSYSKMVYPLR